MHTVPAGRAALSAIAICSVGLQLALLASTMPLGAIGSTQTFWFLDHPFHLYQIELGRQLLAHGQLVGYDPFFETSYGRVHAGGHVASMVALKTGRELMGGAYPFSQSRVSFYDHTGFGKPLAELGVDEIRRGFVLYNIGWIVAHSKDLKEKLATVPFVREAARFDNIVTYVVDLPRSFVVSGNARIAARGFDRVEVVASSPDDLVLRYGWSPLLRTCPAARVEAVVVEPDFAPLVRIVSPPQRFTLTTSTTCDAVR